MSTEVAIVPPKPLTVIERAAVVFAALKSEDELKDLAKASATIVTITNQAGYDQCHAARMVLKNERLEIARTGEDGREDAVQTSKAIIARQKVLVGLLQPEENRLQVIQDAWDAKIAAEKEARIEAERKRVADIRERVEQLRGCQILTPASGSRLIADHIADVEAIMVDASFEEFEAEAGTVKLATLARLCALHEAAETHEAAQFKLIEERPALEKQRTAETERQRLAKIETDRLEKEAHDKRVSDAREHAEKIQAERDRIAQEEAEAKAIRDEETRRQREILDRQAAENARIAAERQADLDRQAAEQRASIAAEEKRLADERATLAAEQEALRKANEPKAEPVKVRTIERPTAAQLVALVSGHYGVSLEMAAKWIQHAKIELEQAA